MPLKEEGFNSIGEFLGFALSSSDEASNTQIKSALFFVRQIISFILGIIAGILHLQGILTIGGFLLTSLGFSYFYVFKYKQVDEDKIENTEIYTEGLAVSIGEFLLTWTLIHTIY